MNNAGQVAGFYIGSNVGFVRNLDGTFALLDDVWVQAINDSGQITGYRFNTSGHGIIGFPTPTSTEPIIRTLLPGVLGASAVGGASSFGGAMSIAPGTWIEIYGQNLAPTTRQWRSSDFTGGTAPTSLKGVSVSINGSPAYISYISPGQVNALVPATIRAGTAMVTVTNGSKPSVPYEIEAVAFQPAILTLPPDVSPYALYAAALFPDFVTFALPAQYSDLPTRYPKAGDTILFSEWALAPSHRLYLSVRLPVRRARS